MVRTQSRPYGLYHHPCTMAHIKRVWIIPICMSMLSMPSLDRSRKPPSSCLRSTTSRGDAPTHARPIGGPSRLILGVVCTEIQVLSLSLSVEEGICLSLAVWQESWLNFKGLPKVSEVAPIIGFF